MKMFSQRSVWALALIVLIGLGLRLLSMQPAAHIDEMLHLATAAGTDGTATNVFIDGQQFWYHRFKPLTILLSWGVDLFGRDMIWPRLLTIASGLLTIVLMYMIGSKINRKAGLIAALLWAISPLAIGINLYVRGYTFFILFNLIVVWLFLQGFTADKHRRTYIAAVVGLVGLSGLYYLYDPFSTITNIVVLLIGLAIFACAYLFFKIRINLHNAVVLGGATAISVPAFMLFANAMGIRSFGDGIIFNQEFAQTLFLSPAYLELNVFFPIAILAIGGILFMTRLNEEQRHTYPAIWLVFIAYLSFYLFAFNRVYIVRYTSYLLPWLLLATSVGGYLLFGHIKGLSKRTQLRVVASLLVFVSIFTIFNVRNVQELWADDLNKRYLSISDTYIWYDFTDNSRFLEDIGYEQQDVIVSSAPLGTLYYTEIDAEQNNLYFYEYWQPAALDELDRLRQEFDRGVFIMLIDHNKSEETPIKVPRSNFSIQDQQYISGNDFQYQGASNGFLYFSWGYR